MSKIYFITANGYLYRYLPYLYDDKAIALVYFKHEMYLTEGSHISGFSKEEIDYIEFL